MSFSDESQRRELTLALEMNNQSDRGAAIIGVAWVEEELQAAIQSILENDKKAQDRLFGRSGSLATFSAKIDLARLLGMCSKVITADLHTLRDIRNEFAHTVASKDHTELTFKSAHIADRCFALKCIAHESNAEPRAAFSRACAILNSDFFMYRAFSQKVSNGSVVFAKVEEES